MDYGPDSGRFEVLGVDARRGQVLEVFYPVSLHGAPEVSVVGLGEVSLVEGAGGELLLRARADGGAWGLLAEPGFE